MDVGAVLFAMVYVGFQDQGAVATALDETESSSDVEYETEMVDKRSAGR